MTESTHALLQRAQQGDEQAKTNLMEENTGLIWSIAKRYFGRGVEPDDLFQLGSLGLLKAMEGFDLEYGTEFSTYAVPKISGEIRRFIRDDGSVKVSRGLKERSASIKMMRQKLTSQWNREPTISELSEALHLTIEEIAEAETATSSTESIHQETGDEGFTMEDVLTDGPMEDGIIEQISLREAVAQLPERERLVISLRYYHGLTQDKTAKIIGVSQVQVSRIEKRSLETLRSYFDK